tara:strand:+ start:402 stop:695 length:294 start_codon:yes stop_codon:yes gene_type:complete
MVSRSRIEMSVGGVQKISLWKMSIIEGKETWEEHPNLPKSFLQTYLNRGFVISPPEPEPEPEEEVQTFSEALESGNLGSEPEPKAPVRRRRRRRQKV